MYVPQTVAVFSSLSSIVESQDSLYIKLVMLGFESQLMKENADLLMDPFRDILNSSFSQFINIVKIEEDRF